MKSNYKFVGKFKDLLSQLEKEMNAQVNTIHRQILNNFFIGLK